MIEEPHEGGLGPLGLSSRKKIVNAVCYLMSFVLIMSAGCLFCGPLSDVAIFLYSCAVSVISVRALVPAHYSHRPTSAVCGKFVRLKLRISRHSRVFNP